MQALSHEQLLQIQMPHQTRHAKKRMNQRGFNDNQISRVIKYGRIIFSKGVVWYVIGRKEVDFYKKEGVDLRDIEGVQLLTTADNVILTVYRNRDLSKIKKDFNKRSF